MEDVLDLYAEPYDEKRPTVGFDETSKQPIAERRAPLPAKSGQPERHDYEYKRHGVRNLFLFCEPRRGWRHVEVTEQRTMQDFARQMKWLVDVAYPEAEVVRVVLDNLNTHRAASLYETFTPEEARRITKRLEFHYTPKHGSWLNIAEIELSVLSRQCLDRRLGDEGTLSAAVRRCAAGLVETEVKIKRGLRRSAVIHADETGLRVNRKLAYVHVASSERLTHYAADARRGKAAIDEIDILPAYRGTCVHDGWLSYTQYPECRHALCGAHLLRELTYFEELCEVTKAWAAPLKELLLEMKGMAERGGAPVPAWQVEELTARYDSLVAAGQEAPPPPDVPQLAWRQARNLLRRLVRRKAEVLRFLSDPAVPFDNNLAERDLRMVKLQQKVSGCLRTGEAVRAGSGFGGKRTGRFFINHASFCLHDSFLCPLTNAARGNIVHAHR